MSCDCTPHGSSTAATAIMSDREPRDALQDDDDLGEHVAAQADHRQQPRADRRLRLEQRLGPVLDDDVDEIEQAAENGEDRSPG